MVGYIYNAIHKVLKAILVVFTTLYIRYQQQYRLCLQHNTKGIVSNIVRLYLQYIRYLQCTRYLQQQRFSTLVVTPTIKVNILNIDESFEPFTPEGNNFLSLSLFLSSLKELPRQSLKKYDFGEE